MASLFRSSASVSAPSSTAAAGSFDNHVPSPTNGFSWLYTTVAIVAGLLVLEQSVYRYKKRHLPGAKWTIPIIGKFADSVSPSMENYMKQWLSGPLSAISVFNIFIVMASSTEYSRKILNSPNHAEPCLVHSAKQIVLPNNWVFLTGKVHVEYRRGLNGLFTRNALALYTTVQDAISRKHYSRWLEEAKKDPSPKQIMMTARNLNMDVSLKVFCGQHITDEAAEQISREYWDITLALELVNFPFALPGTKVYRAIQARKRAMKWLEHAAACSKARMAEGHEPECMVEQWVRDLAEPTYKGRREFSDHEMAMVVFSFLFASQDAMSSSVIYLFQHLADHPDILAKVREEQERVRAGDYNRPLTLDMVDEMVYLRAVVRESLRIKPPVTMVPYKTTKAFPISDDYTVPANSMVIPSFYLALHDEEVYAEPEEFKPERWLDPEGSASKNTKNWLVFGAGPHKCVGEQYAMYNMIIALGNAAALLDFEHILTPESEEVQIIATLFPKDGCLMKFSPRQHA